MERTDKTLGSEPATLGVSGLDHTVRRIGISRRVGSNGDLMIWGEILVDCDTTVCFSIFYLLFSTIRSSRPSRGKEIFFIFFSLTSYLNFFPWVFCWLSLKLGILSRIRQPRFQLTTPPILEN